MLANISTPPTPSVTAWLRCTIRAARPPASPSMSVAVHSGREMSSGDCSATSARSMTSRRVPGSETRTRRTWKSRLKSGSTTQRAGAVGSVGITTFCRSRNTFRDAFSNLVRKRSQSGELSRISSVMIPDRVRGLASPRCNIRSTGLSSSGGPAASGSSASLMAAATLPSLLLLPLARIFTYPR